jgi:hypothetical protein
MPRTHPTQWAAATEEETAAQLHAVVRDHGKFLVHDSHEYPSVSMKTGIRVQELIRNPTLHAAASLDPTGMHFGQLKLQAAVRKTIDDKEYLSHIEHVLREKNWARDADPLDDFARNVTYRLRVQYSHVREKCKAFMQLGDGVGTTHPPELQAIYGLLDLKTNSPQKNRLLENDGIHNNPYLHFQTILKDSESDGEVEVEAEAEAEAEVVIEVFRSFNFHESRAEVIMSDGTIKEASSYEKGQDGFVQAFFGVEAWSTEVPNSALSDDGKVVIRNTTGGMARAVFEDDHVIDGGALSTKHKRLNQHKADEAKGKVTPKRKRGTKKVSPQRLRWLSGWGSRPP